MTSKITKRKLDDAIERLDNALSSSEQMSESTRPSPTKRPHTTSSIFSISRYSHGLFKSSSPKKTPPISLPYALTSKPPFRPQSTQDFLQRLSTFKLTTYRAKPAVINSVAAAKAGWTNEGGNERLFCGNCNASWVVPSTSGLSHEAANALVERQKQGLISNHKEFCPWRKAQCDDSVYRIPLKRPTALAKDLKSRAVAMADIVKACSLKHPLTSSEVSTLVDALSSAATTTTVEFADQTGDEEQTTTTENRPTAISSNPGALNENSAILALFGWDLRSISSGNTPQAAASLSRASSVRNPKAPSISSAHKYSRSLSRASGEHVASVINSPSNGHVRRTSSSSGSPPPSVPPQGRRQASGGSISSVRTSTSNDVLACDFCQRRIAIWSFLPPHAVTTSDNRSQDVRMSSPPPSPVVATHDTQVPEPRPAPNQKVLDVLKEHRSYCPYIVRTTVLEAPVFSKPLSTPSIRKRSSYPSPSKPSLESTSSKEAESSFVEGWRAVLTVVGRSGIGLRARRHPTHRSAKGKENGTLQHGPSVSFAEPGREAPHDMDVDSDRDSGHSSNRNIGVEKIVDNVKKTRDGSRELIRYIKDLLRRGDPMPDSSLSGTGAPTSAPTTPSRRNTVIF